MIPTRTERCVRVGRYCLRRAQREEGIVEFIAGVCSLDIKFK